MSEESKPQWRYLHHPEMPKACPTCGEEGPVGWRLSYTVDGVVTDAVAIYHHPAAKDETGLYKPVTHELEVPAGSVSIRAEPTPNPSMMRWTSVPPKGWGPESKPLTDEDLERIMRVLPEIDDDGEASYGVTLGRLGDGPDTLDTWDVHNLVAEVRRLRSDEWLRAAAEEVHDNCGEWNGPFEPDAEGLNGQAGGILAILRKHREVRRLRSDDWLRAAAEEIDGFQWDEPSAGDPIGTIEAILRKHRDGKA
jgi:hypothetical protein